MAGIVGTITSVNNFLSTTEVRISIRPENPQQPGILLAQNRQYLIPSFQREMRWEQNNLKTLLSDLARGPKFLGNIILEN